MGTVYYINLPLKNGITKEILDEGTAYFNSGEYEQAIAYFEQVPSDSSHYKKAQSLLAEVQSAYQKEIIDRVDSYVEKDEFGTAFELIDEAQEQMLENAGLQEAENYAAAGDYAQAITLIRTAMAKSGQDRELAAKLAVYEDAYVSSVTAAARAQYIEYNADSIFAAEQMIGDALGVLQNNQILVSELDFYREHEPVKIISMPASSSGGSYGRFRTMDSAVDNQGNAYKDVIYVEEFAGRDFDYSEKNGGWSAIKQ